MKIYKCKYCGAGIQKGEHVCQYCKSLLVETNKKVKVNPISKNFSDVEKMVGCSNSLIRESCWTFGLAMSILMINLSIIILSLNLKASSNYDLTLFLVLSIAFAIFDVAWLIKIVVDMIRLKKQLKDDLLREVGRR